MADKFNIRFRFINKQTGEIQKFQKGYIPSISRTGDIVFSDMRVSGLHHVSVNTQPTYKWRLQFATERDIATNEWIWKEVNDRGVEDIDKTEFEPALPDKYLNPRVTTIKIDKHTKKSAVVLLWGRGKVLLGCGYAWQQFEEIIWVLGRYTLPTSDIWRYRYINEPIGIDDTLTLDENMPKKRKSRKKAAK